MKLSNHIKSVSTLTIVLTGALAGLASAVPQELIDGLGDENYQLREKAEQDLAKWAKEKGEGSFDELNDLKKKVQSPEVKSRLENVMSGVNVYKAIPGTRGFMGISMLSRLGSSLINTVTEGSPADKAGLKPNDVILELDGIDLSKKNRHVEEATDFLRNYVKGKKEGEKLTVKINRGGKVMTKDLKLGNYDKYMSRLDPFGDDNIQILPQGGAFQGRIQIAPGGRNIRPRQLNLNPKQLKENEIERLELNLRVQEQMLGKAEFPAELKEMLERQNDINKKRIETLRKELKLEENKEDKEDEKK